MSIYTSRATEFRQRYNQENKPALALSRLQEVVRFTGALRNDVDYYLDESILNDWTSEVSVENCGIGRGLQYGFKDCTR